VRGERGRFASGGEAIIVVRKRKAYEITEWEEKKKRRCILPKKNVTISETPPLGNGRKTFTSQEEKTDNLKRDSTNFEKRHFIMSEGVFLGRRFRLRYKKRARKATAGEVLRERKRDHLMKWREAMSKGSFEFPGLRKISLSTFKGERDQRGEGKLRFR